jgi:hypothetical protein
MRRHYTEQTELDMNCIPGTVIRPVSIFVLGLLVVCGAFVAESGTARAANERVYGADYVITPDIPRAGAYVELRIEQTDGLLRELSMPYDENMISDIVGDGQLSIDDARIRWQPPVDGGQLGWFSKINHLKNGETYDAFVGEEWALFRAEDVIPPTATRTLRRSVSKTRLMFDLPDDWSAVTEYFQRSGVHGVSNRHRRFDKPTGWIVLGRLGVRNETIAGVRVVVAAPVGQAVHRLDILAMLNWTMPDLLRLLPDFPRRLTIVSAGQPMWRGALSAPRSFYVHAERPLISENGTSTIMHEAIHVGLGIAAVKGADWIIEGFSEYYGLQILRRSGTISEKRYRLAMSKLANWGEDSRSLCADSSKASITARAVTLLARLNDEIGRKSDREHDLDDVLRIVADSASKISMQRFRTIVEDLMGSESDVLRDKSLNNCEN